MRSKFASRASERAASFSGEARRYAVDDPVAEIRRLFGAGEEQAAQGRGATKPLGRGEGAHESGKLRADRGALAGEFRQPAATQLVRFLVETRELFLRKAIDQLGEAPVEDFRGILGGGAFGDCETERGGALLDVQRLEKFLETDDEIEFRDGHVERRLGAEAGHDIVDAAAEACALFRKILDVGGLQVVHAGGDQDAVDRLAGADLADMVKQALQASLAGLFVHGQETAGDLDEDRILGDAVSNRRQGQVGAVILFRDDRREAAVANQAGLAGAVMAKDDVPGERVTAAGQNAGAVSTQKGQDLARRFTKARKFRIEQVVSLPGACLLLVTLFLQRCKQGVLVAGATGAQEKPGHRPDKRQYEKAGEPYRDGC